jgi:MFS transporter, SHS family, lactate transporter
MLKAVLSSWTRDQHNAVWACYLGWTLDAFDFFLMVFILEDVGAEFGVPRTDVAVAIFLTLAMRAVGAFVFGRLADRFGCRPMLMVNILLYSVLEFASGFAWSLTSLLVLRALFGVAMGGEWGIGASLTMETIPAKARGAVSGILQAGYLTGYLQASVVFGLLYPWIGWRGMFMVGVLPALLVLYIRHIRRNVRESPSWRPHVGAEGGVIPILKRHWTLAPYAVVLMLSPEAVRGTFPGFVHQLGNLLASANATIQAGIAASHDGNFVLAMAWICGVVAIVIALLAGFGVEAKGTRFGEAAVAKEVLS